MSQQEQILKFWRDIELFTIPKAPSARDQNERTKIWELSSGMPLPWCQHNPKRCQGDEDNFWMHSVFVGVSCTQELTKATLSTILPKSITTLNDLEQCGNDKGCFAMFTVNEAGQPMTDSYVLASYILGIEKLRRGKCLDGITSLLDSECKSFNTRRHAVAIEGLKDEDKKSISPMTWLELQEEFARLICLVGEQFESLNFQFIIKSIIKRRPGKKKLHAANTDVDFLNSFYLNDLDTLIAYSAAGKKFGKALDLYMGDELPSDMRIDILQDTNAFSALLEPERIPPGRWPISSNKHLMLAQQAAVYEVIHDLSEAHGIIGINGPPGTGKTTLLRDIIADVIVQRAEKIAKLNDPLNVFSSNYDLVDGRRIYPLRQEIVGQSGIVVASNNNSAVENITKELPDSENISSEFTDVDYFSEIATKIHCDRNGKGNAWGLIAAVLGNASNKRRFMRNFFQEDIWWDLYFFDSLVKCQPSKFNSSTIILTGTFPNLIAYLIQDKKFIKDKNGNRIAVMVILTYIKESLLIRNEHSKVVFTDDNKTQLSKVISQVVAGAVLLIEESDADVDAVGFIGQISSLKQILEECAKEPKYWKEQWQEAKCDFLEKLRKFQLTRNDLSYYKAKIKRYEKISQEIIGAQTAYDQEKTILGQLKYNYRCKIDLLTQEQKKSEIDLESATEIKQQCEAQAIAASEYLRLAEQRGSPRMWERVLNDWFGKRTQRYARWSNETDTARGSNAFAHQELSSAILNWKQKKENLNKLCQSISRTEAEDSRELREMKNSANERLRNVKKLQEKHSSIKNELFEISSRIQLPDATFWQRPAAEAHLSTVWLNDKIDHLRSQIFISAMHLHEMTIRAGAKYFIANMRATKLMLQAETKEPLSSERISTLWNAFFFVVPVVSTALASFSRLFQGINQENIGWLLIDEAGQATPQSVAGAIWRARRAIIIGDPIQIEPVVTIPKDLVMRLRNEHNVDSIWSPLGESAQTLTDRITRLGAWMGAKNSGVQTWTGLPLRAHRRCASPMFDIANQIAYSGQMVQGNTSPPLIRSILGASTWFDVRSASSDGQIVAEEIELFYELIKRFKAEWPSTDTKYGKKDATVYAISPFSNIAKKCESVVSRLSLTKGDRRVDCGTVHRFQGKEADIVFLILGSAPGRGGSGSRAWASQKPNLLNVALTRAKSLIYVIGNKAEWQMCENFKVLAETLHTASLEQLKHC